MMTYVLGELENENAQLRKLLCAMDSTGRKNAGDMGSEKNNDLRVAFDRYARENKKDDIRSHN